MAKKIGVALIGTGTSPKGLGLGQYVLTAIATHSNAQLVAAAASSLPSVHENVKDNFPNARLFDKENIVQLFALPEVDLVIICSPDETHLPYTLLALKHNKHVLVEKPFVQFASPPAPSTNIELQEAFAIAHQNKLLLSTNCQRAAIPELMGLSAPQKTLQIEFYVGQKKVKPSLLRFFELTISHPVSLLVKLGIIHPDKIKDIKLSSSIVQNEEHIAITFTYETLSARLLIVQCATPRLAAVALSIDDQPSLYVEAAATPHGYKTKYTMNGQSCYTTDLLVHTVHQMINAVADSESSPVITNQESRLIYEIQEVFYTHYINNCC